MHLVHSFSSVRCTPETLSVHIFTFTLSALYAKRSGFDIVLHTDELGAHYFQHAPYDEIIIDIPEPPKDNRIFAWCKFIAMKNEPITSIHIDGDVFLKQPQLKNILTFDDCDIICQSLEKCGVYPYNASVWFNESYAWQDCSYPNWMSRSFDEMYNVGVIGFKDSSVRDEYHNLYSSLMKEFESKGKNIDCVPELISEQKLLYDLAKHKNLKVKCLLDLYNLTPSANKIGYQHLLGESKFKCIEKTKQVLKTLDEELYNKTVKILSEAN